MRTNTIAKNLLQDKTCDTCDGLKHCTFDGKEYCGPAPLSEALRRVSDKECEHWALPKEHTCESWKSIEDFKLPPKMMFPVIRRSYPSLVADELIKEWPKPKK